MTIGSGGAGGIDAAGGVDAVTRERQNNRLKVFEGLAKGIEQAVDTYRDRTREELSNGEFVAQILLAITKHNVSFYFDPPPEGP